MKECCHHWHAIVAAEETVLLDYKKLRSDRGFMVYVTQAYPLLKPYLKGFHLSLETWRGGRDTEGWLIRATQGPAIDSQGSRSTVQERPGGSFVPFAKQGTHHETSQEQ